MRMLEGQVLLRPNAYAYATYCHRRDISKTGYLYNLHQPKTRGEDLRTFLGSLLEVS